MRPSVRRSTSVDRVHLEDIDRAIVRYATIAAGVFFTLLVARWLATGGREALLQSITPASVAATGVAMLVTGRPRALLQLIVGSLGLVFYISVSEAVTPGDPLLGLLVIAIAGTVLVRRYVAQFAGAAALVIGGAAWAWHPEGTAPTDRMLTALSATTAFVFIAWLLTYLQAKSGESRRELAQLVDAKDEFLATVSHELRTPVTTIVGLAEELYGRYEDFSPEEIRQLLALIVADGHDVASIVEDLLIAVRADLGGLLLSCEPVDVRQIVRAAAGEAGDVVATCDETAPSVVWTDPVRIGQIVRNLVANAKRFGGADVRVTLQCTEVEAIVAVRDDGPPISLSNRELIFEPYHRAERRDGQPATVGLGLTVARRLARLLGGDVTYHHDGRDSVFTVRLPRIATGGTAPDAVAV